MQGWVMEYGSSKVDPTAGLCLGGILAQSTYSRLLATPKVSKSFNI